MLDFGLSGEDPFLAQLMTNYTNEMTFKEIYQTSGYRSKLRRSSFHHGKMSNGCYPLTVFDSMISHVNRN